MNLVRTTPIRRQLGHLPTTPAILLGAAIVVLLSSVFTGWYSLHYNSHSNCCSETWNETFYLYPRSFRTYTFQGGPRGVGTYNGPVEVSGFPGLHVSQLYLGVLVALVVALGCLTGTMILLVRRFRRVEKWELLAATLACVAAALSLATPLALVVLQPEALHQDLGAMGSGGTPASAFFGPCSASLQCLSPASNEGWGPGVGWYLSMAAGALLLTMALLLLRSAKRRPDGDV